MKALVPTTFTPSPPAVAKCTNGQCTNDQLVFEQECAVDESRRWFTARLLRRSTRGRQGTIELARGTVASSGLRCPLISSGPGTRTTCRGGGGGGSGGLDGTQQRRKNFFLH